MLFSDKNLLNTFYALHIYIQQLGECDRIFYLAKVTIKIYVFISNNYILVECNNILLVKKHQFNFLKKLVSSRFEPRAFATRNMTKWDARFLYVREIFCIFTSNEVFSRDYLFIYHYIFDAAFHLCGQVATQDLCTYLSNDNMITINISKPWLVW